MLLRANEALLRDPYSEVRRPVGRGRVEHFLAVPFYLDDERDRCGLFIVDSSAYSGTAQKSFDHEHGLVEGPR